MIPIVPAIIPKSEDQLRLMLSKLDFSTEIHIDVVDGEFVPYVSWPYDPVGEPLTIKDMTDGFTLEVDLMVSKPLPEAEKWIEAGADMLVFHVETIGLQDFTNFVQQTSVSIGISALNDTSTDIVLKYIAVADYVQLMGIAKIGAQGQSFDDRVLERIGMIKKDFLNLPISVDGSMNKETILKVKEAGANRIIVGSAVVLAENPYASYVELLNLANNLS